MAQQQAAPSRSAPASDVTVAETYLAEISAIHSTGAAVPETSYYPPLSNLFNAAGALLAPKVRCVINTRNKGAGIPDGGLFTADQFQRQTDAEPIESKPTRGAIEVKPPKEDVHAVAQSDQVRKYLAAYGIVLVTNLREFLIVERGPKGEAVERESFAFADNEKDFWRNVAAHPRAAAQHDGVRFAEFIKRACLHNAPLNNPQDVAWFLASYAREALARVELRGDLEALRNMRDALEQALGMKFTADKGEHFFRSTLVQTIFYGVFSAWVLWSREKPGPKSVFDWKSATWTLHVPFIRTLYDALATPDRLGPLKLVEVLEWTAGVLNRVDRAAFFSRFQDDHAVQYFYEPFLEAYDPELRKDLGVWYTPPEIVKYQVERVDAVLRSELGLADGLADPDVIVLDPCCGTGAYLVEVLARIAQTLRDKGGDALVAADLKRAATERVFGFEIMPAPFVVSHLQLGLLLQDAGAPLSRERGERAGVYLTNALTGWEPPKEPKTRLVFPELAEERDAANEVKRAKKILVVLGNPPYNAYAGISPEEERGLVEPYKEGLNKPIDSGGWGIKKFNLDDLYVRFFRLAERRIAEMSGKGVVSFISNQSWVSDPSFVVLRSNLLESFDKFWIENLHGNRKISEYAPDGRTSETVFAIQGFSVGIQQGVATSLWVKTGKARKKPAEVRFRDDIDGAKAADRRGHLLATLKKKNFDKAYTLADPSRENRFSFRPEEVSDQYNAWPRIVDFCALPPINGLMEKRGGALIEIGGRSQNDTGRAALAERMKAYFDPDYDWDEYKALGYGLTKKQAAFDPKRTRTRALEEEDFDKKRVVRYAVRPFDTRWCYYTAVNPVWNRARPSLWAQCWEGNKFLMVRPAGVADPEGVPFSYTGLLGDNDYLRGHAYYVPIQLRNGERIEKKAHEPLFAAIGEEPKVDKPFANLSRAAREYLAALKITDPDGDAATAGLIWMHAMAIGYSPAWLAENTDGVRRDWPRIPLPKTRKLLEASAALGTRLATLLDSEAEVPGVTADKFAPLCKIIGVLTKSGGGQINPGSNDLALTAGWGHRGKAGVTMPGRGLIAERAFDDEETAALEAEAKAAKTKPAALHELLGEKTLDVHLNGGVYWRNIPAKVWGFHIGGYQVIKKWLSYREHELLDRALTPDETREVTSMARRLTAILLLQPALDDNYRAVTAAAYAWRSDGT